jgi:mono/diheme cytochrome c family protein
MGFFRMGVAVACFALCATANGQRSRPAPPGFPDAPGKDVFVSKCFQCHGPNMFTSQRQDRRAWESVLYRMVGRGALWTEEEIRAMADYLAAVYGKEARK